MPRVQISIFALACLAASACVSGTVEVPSSDAGVAPDLGPADLGVAPDLGPVDMGDPTLTEVPSDLPLLTVTSSCTELNDGEQPWSVDAEGFLWLVRTVDGQTVVRSVDAWGSSPPRAWSTRLGAVDHLRAESATVATVVSEGELWSLEAGSRVRISAPFSPAVETTSCGEIGERGFVLSGGQLYQRDGEAWVVWSGLDSALMGASALLPRDGACRSSGDTLHIASGGLDVWALTPGTIQQVATLPQALQADFRDSELLVVSQDGLLYQDTSTNQRWRFADGAVTEIAAAGSYAWLRIGDAIVRFDGTDFLEAIDVRGRVELFPFAAGGLWITSERSACAITPAEMIRTRGLSVSGSVDTERFRFQARSASGAAVQARLDTTALSPIAEMDGWLVFEGSMSPGWSTLTLTSGAAERRREIRRAGDIMPPAPSWATDIQPIYTAHCAFAACHVADSPASAPNLDTLASWVALSDAIERRVVNGDDMPPPASRGPTWGPDIVRTIQEWIVGGLRP